MIRDSSEKLLELCQKLIIRNICEKLINVHFENNWFVETFEKN